MRIFTRQTTTTSEDIEEKNIFSEELFNGIEFNSYAVLLFPVVTEP